MTSHERLIRNLWVLADQARLNMIAVLAAAPDGLNAGDIGAVLDTPLSQPTVSHHLQLLLKAGYVSREKRSTYARYRLDPVKIRDVLATVENLL